MKRWWKATYGIRYIMFVMVLAIVFVLYLVLTNP